MTVGASPGRLDPRVKAGVERLAQRYLGDPDAEDPGVSPLLDHAEGRLNVRHQEHRRFRTAFLLRMQRWPATGRS